MKRKACLYGPQIFLLFLGVLSLGTYLALHLGKLLAFSLFIGLISFISVFVEISGSLRLSVDEKDPIPISFFD